MEHLENKHLESMDYEQEKEQEILFNFFCGDYELFQECEKERLKNAKTVCRNGQKRT